VAFWGEGGDVGPLLSIEIFIPSHWSPADFLFQLDITLDNCPVISLLNTYMLFITRYCTVYSKLLKNQ
jgi:hypothetical protein